MAQPCTIPCGHTFDKACLQRALTTSKCCPMCREKVSNPLPSINVMMRNLALKLAPDEVKQREQQLDKQQLAQEPACQLCGDLELVSECHGCHQVELCSMCMDTICYECNNMFCDHCTANLTVACVQCLLRKHCLDCEPGAGYCVACSGTLCGTCIDSGQMARCPGCQNPVCDSCWNASMPTCMDCNAVILRSA
jgi:hypothetical protein